MFPMMLTRPQVWGSIRVRLALTKAAGANGDSAKSSQKRGGLVAVKKTISLFHKVVKMLWQEHMTYVLARTTYLVL